MTSRSFLLRLFAGMLMLLGVAVSASAQRNDDGYRILQAHYGTPRNHVDVTDQLKRLAEQERSFRMGNASFGVDPAPGQVKTLRIYARGRDRQTRTFEYVEGSIVDGSRFAGWDRGDWGRGGWNGGWGGTPYYSAAAANPGRNGQARGGDQGEVQILQARYGTARNNVDVTERLRELARRDRSFRMGNDSFGVDPAPGQVKQLRIYARAGNGQTRTYEYTEGSIVDGAQFGGWGDGGWGRRGGYDGNWGGTPYYSAPVVQRDQPRNADRGTSGRANDSGEFQILQARYGTARNNVDVTDRLRDLARNDRSFRIANNTFGVDPAPGEVKQLRIFTRTAAGATRTFEYAEGGSVDGAQFSGWSGGNWGRGGHDGSWGPVVGGAAAGAIIGGNPRDGRPVVRDAPIAAPAVRDPGQVSGGRLNIVRATYGSGNQVADVTARVRERMQFGKLELFVGNEDMGSDPAPNRPKTLTVTYTVDGGRPQEARVAESQIISLP